jgi:hypothetical protein
MMLPLYGILEAEGGTALYWYCVSFARLLGAALFGFGLLLWASRQVVVMMDSNQRRRLNQALVMAYLLSLMVALTQQISIWGTPLGWVTTGVPFLLLIGYVYSFVRPE